MSDKLKNADVCLDGPFEVELKIHITNDDGEAGEVTYKLGAGTVPTQAAITKALQEAEALAKEHGRRLMNRHEFIEEMLGAGPVAVPGPKEFRGR